ncbi:MAG TPA: oligopeptide transporter, OPT family [Vicinamibacteria bacterium]|nr:oligopeptide transporter, OPT family [Vicinamibacteria bacterium]
MSAGWQPHVGPDQSPPEFTLRALVPGVLFGIVFGAANAYLGLRAGLTISTSIPIAVITMAAFKAFAAAGRPGSILEANMSQTVGSASSSVASGVIFTLPALFLWNLDPTLVQMTLLAMTGGVLGTLFMIPLRAFLIEREHGRLPYPEGTACAQVLLAGERGGGRSRNVFLGLAAGGALKAATGWARVAPEEVEAAVPGLPKGQIASDISAALFGVGYILGPRIAAVMVAGGLLSSLVIIPALAVWGEGRATPLYPETVKTIAAMSPGEIWSRYVRYIGAGAVATAGFITLGRGFPTMVGSFRVGVAQIRTLVSGRAATATRRTARDLPFTVILAGLAVLASLMASLPQMFSSLPGPFARAVAALLVVVSAFFFVTVSSRIVGLVGVTSNPTSGMTIATLLVTSSVFLLMGWTGDAGKVGALTVGCVVAIAASIAGDTSQDLKTGYLLGATPRLQQAGEILGVVTSAAFVCLTVLLLDRVWGFGTRELPAPQATLMKLVIEGVLDRSLPWALVGLGALLALGAEAVRVPSLPFAVGVYLPVSTMVPVFLGGLLRHVAERRAPSPDAGAERREQGTLFGSGLVGGEGLVGVGIAAAALLAGGAPAGIGPGWSGGAAPAVAVALFALLAWLFWRRLTASTSPRSGAAST